MTPAALALVALASATASATIAAQPSSRGAGGVRRSHDGGPAQNAVHLAGRGDAEPHQQANPANEPLAELINTWRAVLRTLSWVRAPQRALMQAAGQRFFARWYVRNLLEWEWKRQGPKLSVSRVVLRRNAEPIQPVNIRPLTELEDLLVVMDGAVAVCLAFRVAWLSEDKRLQEAAPSRCLPPRLARRVPTTYEGAPATSPVEEGCSWQARLRRWLALAWRGVEGGSAMGRAYFAVAVVESFADWNRPWRRASPVGELFGATPGEQRLATWAQRLARDKLKQNVVRADVESLRALSWRLGIASAAWGVARVDQTHPSTGHPRAPLPLVGWWLLFAVLGKIFAGCRMPI